MLNGAFKNKAKERGRTRQGQGTGVEKEREGMYYDDPSRGGGLERGMPLAWEYGGVGNLGSAYTNMRGMSMAHRGSALAAQYPSGKVHPNLAMFGNPSADPTDFGAGARAYAVPGADYMRLNAAQPLLPQRIHGGAIDPSQGFYIGEGHDRGRNGVRGRRRSPTGAHSSRSSSGGRHRAARRPGNRETGVDRYGDTEDSDVEEEAGDAEIAARVEGVEEELRALTEDTRERDAHVNEQVTRALEMAEKIGSGPKTRPIL